MTHKVILFTSDQVFKQSTSMSHNDEHVWTLHEAKRSKINVLSVKLFNLENSLTIVRHSLMVKKKTNKYTHASIYISLRSFMSCKPDKRKFQVKIRGAIRLNLMHSIDSPCIFPYWTLPYLSWAHIHNATYALCTMAFVCRIRLINHNDAAVCWN